MNLNPLFPTLDNLAINTDLYELTMAAAYFESSHHQERATFELFTRHLPETRNFLVAAGLEQALHYIQNIRFSEESIRYLVDLEPFQKVSPAFFDYLRSFHFSGDVYALPEGSLFFANEPILQVTAPVIEAQLLETFLINIINVQTMIASKATRVCLAAQERMIVDFGSRRAHGPQTGVLAARSAFIGGCAGSSNVLAGFELGIPVYGTMAHSFVQFFDREKDAFQAFYSSFPEHAVLLVDTYDTAAGIEHVLDLQGAVAAIRLDSGDLATLARQARQRLDDAGRFKTRIFASGNLDEEQILGFSLHDVPIDAYGVGTALVVSADAPSCDLVYKLVEVQRGERHLPRFKASPGKAIFPFRKQVFRHRSDNMISDDTIARHDEAPPQDREASQPLLRKYLEGGKQIEELPALSDIQDSVRKQLAELPTSYKHLHTSETYPVRFSTPLEQTQRELAEQHRPGSASRPLI